MLTLYYAPDNASLIVRLALEEAGIAYETVLVDRAARAHKAPDYLALNPCGVIPTLMTPQGPLAETAACLLWLNDSHPQAGLGPAVGDHRRAMFLRWLFFLSNTIHADLARVFYPDRYVPPETVAFHHAAMARRISEHLSILDAAVRADPGLFEPPSVLGLYVGPLIRWGCLYPQSAARWLELRNYPALEALVTSLECRASVRAAVLAEGLGDRPFSSPQLADPPEGSAT